MLRVLWNVAENNLVWISLNKLVLGVRIWWNTTNNLGVGVLELSVSSKLLSLLLVSVFVGHKKFKLYEI